MKKGLKRVSFCLMLAAVIWVGTVVVDRQKLNDELIRLHVVGASNSEEDQAIKLRVKDAIAESLQAEMENIKDMDQAKAYLQENLPKIEAIANRVLSAAGFDAKAAATLGKEVFDTRYYDTFTLPAGVYEALRITIGEGEGKNWWCVVFPSLCLPATSAEFEDVAVGSGFSDTLTATLEGKEGYELRFYLLDLLGSVENIFFRG